MQIVIRILPQPNGQVGLACESPLPAPQTIGLLSSVIGSLAAQIPVPPPEPRVQIAGPDDTRKLLSAPVANGHQ